MTEHDRTEHRPETTGGAISRRGALTGLAAAVGATGLGVATASGAQARPSSRSGRSRWGSGRAEETKSLDTLHQEALAEGRGLVVYSGGDTPTQQDGTRAAFEARFPGVPLTIVVDYSKFHDVRLDRQFAARSVVPDVVQLQTLQDFTRWQQEGRLMPYRPAGTSALHSTFRDPTGTWTSVGAIGFSYAYDVAATGGNGPATPEALVDPAWRGAIASSYPHDDDAVLYLFSRYVDAYGWDWIDALAAQQLEFNRGSNTPIEAVASGRKPIGLGTAGSLATPSDAPLRWVVAEGHPFMGWGQRAAILAGTSRPAAAKLYLNWQLSVENQMTSFNGWSVREDVTPPSGVRPIWDYPEAGLEGFPEFMADRAKAERLRQTFALVFGEVQGPPSPGSLGLRPGA